MKNQNIQTVLRPRRIKLVMINDTITSIFNQHIERYETALVPDDHFEPKGILNSEMILFMAMADLLGVTTIVESGRARAQSTEVLCRYCKSADRHISFKSIEYDANSPDVIIAQSRLEQYLDTVSLEFGDSEYLLPKIVADSDIESSLAVLIDGPKGYDALELARKLLHDERVAVVAIHDLHKNTGYQRKIAELWPNILSSDHPELVNKISTYDKSCWARYESLGYDLGPFLANGKQMISYGPTLVFLVNTGVSSVEREKALLAIKNKLRRPRLVRRVIKIILKAIPGAFKKSIIGVQIKKLLRI